jgi:hypothetical protein
MLRRDEMEHYKTITVPPEPEKTKEVFDHYTCDICGSKAKNKENWDSNEKYYVNKVTIKHIVGNSFPEGGGGKEYHLDICPKCFTNRILPKLKLEFDIEPRKREWDY